MKKIIRFLIIGVMLMSAVSCTTKPHPPTGVTAEGLISTEWADWMNHHQDSNDPVDVALLQYYDAQELYIKEHPEVGLRSDWGVDYNGEFSILTDLGVAGLPGLLEQVDANNPFRVKLIFAIEEICKTDIGYCDTFSPEQITAWKISFNNTKNDAKTIASKVVSILKNKSSANDEEINTQLADAGIFALPYFYDEVINKSNVILLKYADKILPDEKLKEFNISSGSQDLADYRKALASCSNDINIINNLAVK